MTVSELWRVVFAPAIMLLSVAIGTAVGAINAILLLIMGQTIWPVGLVFSVLPLAVNVGSASLMSLQVWWALRRRPQVIDIVPVPSVLTVLLTLLVLTVPLVLLGNAIIDPPAGLIWVGYAMALVVYCAISEVMHHLVFLYVAPSIWERHHVYSVHAKQAPADPETLIAPTSRKAPPLDQVEIGETALPAGEIVALAAQGNYLRIVTRDSEHVERFKISTAVDMLPENAGIMTHRSNWLAFGHMLGVERLSGKYAIRMSNDELFAVALTREDAVIETLAKRGFEIPVKARRTGV